MGKRNNFNIKNYKLFILTTCLCLSAGCSNSIDSGDIDDIEVPKNDRLETTIENIEGETFVRIEADIIGDDSDSFPVVTLRKYVFTEEDIKTYADAFFDNAEYHNKKNIDEYTVSDLDEIIERHNKYKEDFVNSSLSAAMTDTEYNEIVNSIDKYINCYTDLRAKAPTDVTLRCDIEYVPFEIEKDPISYLGIWYGWLGPSGCKYCILEGMHNGIPYTLIFTRDDERNLTCMRIEMNSPDTVVWEDFTFDQVYYCTDIRQTDASYGISGENECKYTEDEAIAICNHMINTLQISDMDVISVVDCDTRSYLSNFTSLYPIRMGVCGYDIAYGKAVNNKSINYDFSNVSSGIYSLISIDDETYEAGHETLIFSVMDSGIVSLDYNFPTTIESVASETTPLLSFDVVMTIFENRMIEEYGSSRYYMGASNNIVISKIQLGLCRLTVDDSNGEYTLIPVWDFYSSEYSTVMTINAIDGSIIDSSTGRIIE